MDNTFRHCVFCTAPTLHTAALRQQRGVGGGGRLNRRKIVDVIPCCEECAPRLDRGEDLTARMRADYWKWRNAQDQPPLW